MLTRRLALVDKTGAIGFDQLSKVAAAINLQVQRDLAPIWNVSATVSSVPTLDALPAGVVPIFIVDDLPAGEGGVHLTDHNQPYARVAAGDGWTIAASHEALELLVDPGGNQLYPSTSIVIADGAIQDGVGKFEYLLEICDPSEDDPYAYAIDDVTVSDFFTPHFFDPVAIAGVRYSFTGALTRPRQVLKNGYLSWFNADTGTMQQLKYADAPNIVDLGAPQGTASLREFVDNRSRPTVALSQRSRAGSKVLSATSLRAQALARLSKQRARFYPGGGA